ncbi:MAG: hypothetical protein COA57_03120 [Flavobacteriales bacterium]|nr:MAG: hypothetical protein COA57_03120 [Flavobacteriales bacterium]
MQISIVRKVLLILNLFILLNGFSETKSVDVVFYSEKHTIFYHQSMLSFPKFIFEEGFFEYYHNYMDTAAIYEGLLQGLREIKEKRKLNDWLYYNLLRTTTDKILIKEKEHTKTLFNWFMLAKSGYDVRLELQGKKITLGIFTEDMVYGCPQSKTRGGYFVDITSFHNSINYEKFTPFRVKYRPNKKNRIPFSFSFDEAPDVYQKEIIQKTLEFKHDSEVISISVSIDNGYVEYLKKYPELGLVEHSKLPLSFKAYTSLVPSLKKHIFTNDTITQLRFLLSFTRTAFQYKKDEAVHNKKIIYAPEETLLSDHSDYEDRAIMFRYLCKELLNINVKLIKMSKRTFAAVKLKRPIGKPLIYETGQYTFLDPTNPKNELGIGEYPEGYERKSYKFYD